MPLLCFDPPQHSTGQSTNTVLSLICVVGVDIPTLYNNLVLIQGHENAHAEYLKNVIVALGGTPASPCPSYAFSSYLTDASSFISNAYSFEKLGVQAYDGALNTLSNPTLQQGAATIATIEARHATYLQQFADNSDYLKATDTTTDTIGSFDKAASPNDVANQVAPLLQGGTCGTITLPVARSVPGNYTTAYVSGTSSTLVQNDVNALNYALFLENFENAFYNYFVGTNGKFSTNDFTQAGLPSDTYARFQLIAAHEAAHVSFLNTGLTNAKATPKAACGSYNFTSITTVKQFVATAAQIEAAGVSAYDGAINSITNPAYAQAAATIATVEVSAVLSILSWHPDAHYHSTNRCFTAFLPFSLRPAMLTSWPRSPLPLTRTLLLSSRHRAHLTMAPVEHTTLQHLHHSLQLPSRASVSFLLHVSAT